MELSGMYSKLWESNMCFSRVKENEEFNSKVNQSWRYMAKDNPKKLWSLIDYNMKNEVKEDSLQCMSEKMIVDYFSDIFQSKRLANNPVVDDVEYLLNSYHMYIPILDDEFTLDELNYAITKNGRGTGIDSIDKRVALLFSQELRCSILKLFNHVFISRYPQEWTRQLLRPEKKKGHSLKEPKLRGIAITQLLPTLYDIMLFNRFNLWYCPNYEQAGFRPKQGCLFQIFAIYIVMEMLKAVGKSVYVGFIDYEKAFDFVNRANIIKHMKEKGAGAKFTKAVASMYNETFYVPKLCNRIGEEILAKHGVTQGRQTSTSFFSFEVQDMAKCITVPESCINDFNLLQLADDSALLAETKLFLHIVFQQCLKFSRENYMVTNIGKTYFLHLSDNNTDVEPIILEDGVIIKSAPNNEHTYLGMKFIASNNIVSHIKKNFNDRAFNIAKYYDWLDINELTPVKIKVQVLYTCMFSSYLYGAEAWYRIDDVSEQLLLLERKLLKSILGVKRNTPDILLYLELGRPNIVALTKHRQKSFFDKLTSLNDNEAVARRIVTLNHHLPACTYYRDLESDIVKLNIAEMKENLNNSVTTYLSRYRHLIDTKLNHIVYDTFVPERTRIVITRWRLSNHRLKIETGRYDPYVARHLRKCLTCNIVEDEYHALYQCPLYDSIRVRFDEFLLKYSTIDKILNPTCCQDAITLGNFLTDIESCRESLQLQ